MGTVMGLTDGWDLNEKDGVVVVLMGGTGVDWGAVAPKVKYGVEVGAVVGRNGFSGGNAGVVVGGTSVVPNVKLVEGAVITGGTTVCADMALKVKGVEDGSWVCFMLLFQNFWTAVHFLGSI